MSGLNDPARVVNRRTVLAPVFDPDPRGWRMFANLAARAQRGLNGADGRAYAPMPGYAGGAWHGDAGKSLQHFTGQAALGVGLGAGRPYPDGRTDLQRETSSLLMNTQMRIYAERLKRTMGTGSAGAALIEREGGA